MMGIARFAIAALIGVSSNVWASGDEPVSPYLACSGTRAQDLAPTGFFVLDTPQVAADGARAIEYMRAVGTGAQDLLAVNQTANVLLWTCLRSSRPTVVIEGEEYPCEPTYRFAREEFRPLVTRARQELAMALNAEGMVQGHSDSVDVRLNTRLLMGGYLKEVSWQPLLEPEERAARRQWEAELEIARASVDEQLANAVRSPDHAFQALHRAVFAERVRALRQMHIVNYRRLSQELLLLSYIRSAAPRVQELIAAIRSTALNNETESAVITRLEGSLGTGRVKLKTLSLLDYDPVAQEILIARPDLCSIATSLFNHRFNHRLRFMAAFAPALIGGIFAPPAWGVALGGAGLYVFATQAARDLEIAKRQALIGAFGVDYLRSLPDAQEALDEYRFQIATAPMVLLGAPLARWFFQATRATRVARSSVSNWSALMGQARAIVSRRAASGAVRSRRPQLPGME